MYNHKEIEKKWQNFWEKNKTFKTPNPGDKYFDETKPKYYTLDMFPYPSGAGLHVGHPEGYTANDIIARYKHAKGYNVLHPMGWDAFGLPAENYAIKTGTHPRITTDKNINTFRQQIKSLGISYDWDREVDTTDPKYYKWTQWIFLKMFEAGLAYEQDLPINYCPSCKTGLANEEVLNDFTCERCGTKVEKKKIRQWVLAITKYADRLLKDVDKLDWPEGIKEMQRNWIGKNTGVKYKLKIKDSDLEIETYSTHFEAFYADTFAVIAADHDILPELVKGVENEKEILDFAQKINNQKVGGGYKEVVDHEGIFTGKYLLDPITKKEMPLWISSYALSDYGTGIIKCSAHDERDFSFAKKYNIPLRVVMFPKNATEEEIKEIKDFKYCYNDFKKSVLILPEEFAGRKPLEAHDDIIKYLLEKGYAEESTQYKLRDWLFSRQRYWGEPIPLIHLEIQNVKKLPHISEEEFVEIQKEIENLINKKMKVAPLSKKEWGIHNETLAKPSLIDSIFKNTKKVKKKRKKSFKLKEFQDKITLNNGPKIQFSGRYLINHFKDKQTKEFLNRIYHAQTILKNLENVNFLTDTFGIINISEKYWVVILEKLSSGDYEVITFYEFEKLNKILDKAYILKREPKEGEDVEGSICKGSGMVRELIIGGKVFSKIYDGIYGKIVCDYNLPLELPKVKKFEPAGDGQSPLAAVDSFVNVRLAENLVGKRETNTMPQWGGSCWYYLRYMDPDNKEMLVSPEAEKYWGQVDSYVGGAEHAVLHLLYARFWHKFLFDIGVVSHDEPFYRLRNQGLIQSYIYVTEKGKSIHIDLVEEKNGKYFNKETGEKLEKKIGKMSKSLGNVVNPDEIIEEYGADSLRLYEMYMAEFKDSAPWDSKNIIGVKRFLEKIERLYTPEAKIAKDDKETIKLLHKTIKKVSEDIENYKFNTAISSMMILVNNGLPKDENLKKDFKEKLAIILSPFAPHLAEELWERLGNKKSIFNTNWPKYDKNLIIDNTIKIAVQVLGKVRGTIEISKDEDNTSVLKKAKNDEGVKKWLDGKKIVKEIYIPGKIVNFVVK